MGTADKTVRIITAVIFGILYFTDRVSGLYGTILLILGIAFLLTSLIVLCPLYSPFKISTEKKEQKS